MTTTLIAACGAVTTTVGAIYAVLRAATPSTRKDQS
jgi:hypothetical protein